MDTETRDQTEEKGRKEPGGRYPDKQIYLHLSERLAAAEL